MIRLENWCYQFKGFWRLHGNVYGHPKYVDGALVFVSTPEFFNQTKMIVRGISGREYQLGKCASDDISKQIEYIRDDIIRNTEHERLS